MTLWVLLQATQSGQQSGRGGEDEAFGFIKNYVTEDVDSENQQKLNKSQLLQAISEKHQYVEWTGEVFRMKPVKLFRLNLSAFRSRSNIAIANVQVHR